MDKKRALLPIALALLVLLAAGVSSLAAGAGTPKVAPLPPRHLTPRVRHVNPLVTRKLRTATWHWQAVMGLGRTHSRAPLSSPRALRFWRGHARAMLRRAARPPHRSAWLCIHHYEGSWRDSGDPYWGGLQMDRGFMRTYAAHDLLRRGWANSWSPLEQMWVAERAYRSGRGFYPWPNTARYCGLI
ncbi:MAG: hypothetical protein ACXVRD_10260 [Gaiellaceae bacterium]